MGDSTFPEWRRVRFKNANFYHFSYTTNATTSRLLVFFSYVATILGTCPPTTLSGFSDHVAKQFSFAANRYMWLVKF